MKYNISVLFEAGNDEDGLKVANKVKEVLAEWLEGDMRETAKIAIVRMEPEVADKDGGE